MVVLILVCYIVVLLVLGYRAMDRLDRYMEGRRTGIREKDAGESTVIDIEKTDR